MSGKCWVPTKQENRIEAVEMRFLRNVEGYTWTEHIGNQAVRQQLKVFNILDKVVEYSIGFTTWKVSVEEDMLKSLVLYTGT